jgi:hypothetical protein
VLDPDTHLRREYLVFSQQAFMIDPGVWPATWWGVAPNHTNDAVAAHAKPDALLKAE